MEKSGPTLTKAEVLVQREKADAEAVRLELAAQEKREEVKRHDWVLKTYFSKEPKPQMPKTVLEMVEQVLLESKKAMTPGQLHVAIKKLGYNGDPGNIHPRIYKWMKRGTTKVVKVGDGLYAHKSHAAVLSKDVLSPLQS